MSAIIQLRRASASYWASINPTLAQGEFGFEVDTLKMKIGDGVTAWNSLHYYISGSGGDIGGSGTAGMLPVFTAATTIGDSAAAQVPGPSTAGEYSIGVNIVDPQLTAVCLGGGAFVAAQKFGDASAPYPAFIALSKDNAVSMLGAGTGYEWWGTYYDPTTPAAFRMAGIYSQHDVNPTITPTTHKSSLHFGVSNSGIQERFSMDYLSVFRFYNQNGMTEGEKTAWGFLAGEFANIQAGSQIKGGIVVTGSTHDGDPDVPAVEFICNQARATGNFPGLRITVNGYDGVNAKAQFPDDFPAMVINNPLAGNPLVFMINGNGKSQIVNSLQIGTLTNIPAEIEPYTLAVKKVGTVNVNVDFAALINTQSSGAMIGTETGFVFRQFAYNGGTPAALNAGRISFRCTGTFANTATSNGSLVAYTLSQAVMDQKLEIDTIGSIYGYCPVAAAGLTANEQTAFGTRAATSAYAIVQQTGQGGLLSSSYVAASSAHAYGFNWQALLGDEPTLSSHYFNAAKHNGSSGLTTIADGSFIAEFANNGNVKFSVAGNGDIAWTGAASGTIDGGGA
jgi:hypothetical protein